MASSSKKLVEEIYDQFLVCKICYDIYKNPKTLSCLHTFCTECLEKHQESELERSYRYLLYSRAVSCPICRKKTEVPAGGVRRLPDNFLVANLSDVINRRKPNNTAAPCGICKPKRNGSDSSNIAVSKCIECSKLLCRACVELHRKTKVTQSHGLFDIDVEKEIECKVHKDEVVRFYCEPCQVCVCVLCTFQEHKGHEVSSFTEGIERYREAIDDLLQRCRSRIAELREKLHVLNECESDMKHTEEQIRDMAVNSISAIRRKEKEMLRDLYEVFGEDTVEFFSEKEHITENIENLQSTCNLTDIFLKDKSIELLLLKREIQEKLNTLLQRNWHTDADRLLQRVKFIPGNLIFGYLQTGKGLSEDFVDDKGQGEIQGTSPTDLDKNLVQQYRRLSEVHTKTQTDISAVRNISGTQADWMRNSTTNTSATDSKSTMTHLDVTDQQTMTSGLTPTMKRKIQTDLITNTDQGTLTTQKPLMVHCAVNTKESRMRDSVNKGTVTYSRQYSDMQTETMGLVSSVSKQTSMVLPHTVSTGVGMDRVVYKDKGVVTHKPRTCDKVTSMVQIDLVCRGANTQTIDTADMAVQAKEYGKDKSTGVSAPSTSNIGVGDGNVMTPDRPTGIHQSTMTINHPGKHQATYTSHFNMADRATSVDPNALRVPATETDDKAVSVDIPPHQCTETLDSLCQTVITLIDSVMPPKADTCTQSTNTYSVSLSDRGVGTTATVGNTQGTNTVAVECVDQGVNTKVRGLKLSDFFTKIKKDRKTERITFQDAETETSAVIQTDSSNDAFRGYLVDSSCNTDSNVIVKPAVVQTDASTSTDHALTCDRSTTPVIELQQTSKQLVDAATSTTCAANTQEAGTTMGSHVCVSHCEATASPMTVDQMCQSRPMTNDLGVETELPETVDTGIITDTTATTTVGTSMPIVARRDASVGVIVIPLKDSGTDPVPPETRDQHVGTPHVLYSTVGTGTLNIKCSSKSTGTDVKETAERSTHTFVQQVEKATYMPQTITLSTGTSTLAPATANKRISTDSVESVSAATMTKQLKTQEQETTMGRYVEMRNQDTTMNSAQGVREQSTTMGRSVVWVEQVTSTGKGIKSQDQETTMGRRVTMEEHGTSFDKAMGTTDQCTTMGRNIHTQDQDTTMGRSVSLCDQNTTMGRSVNVNEQETTMGRDVSVNEQGTTMMRHVFSVEKDTTMGRSVINSEIGTTTNKGMHCKDQDTTMGRNLMLLDQETSMNRSVLLVDHDTSMNRNVQTTDAASSMESSVFTTNKETATVEISLMDQATTMNSVSQSTDQDTTMGRSVICVTSGTTMDKYMDHVDGETTMASRVFLQDQGSVTDKGFNMTNQETTMDRDVYTADKETTIDWRKDRKEQETSMGSLMNIQSTYTNTLLIPLTDSANDPITPNIASMATSTEQVDFCDASTSPEKGYRTEISTTTDHSVHTGTQSTNTELRTTCDHGTETLKTSVDTKETTTEVEMKSVGILKRPHAISRGTITRPKRMQNSSTSPDLPYVVDETTMTQTTQTAEKTFQVGPVGLVTTATCTPVVEQTERYTATTAIDISDRASSPILPRYTDRGSSPIIIETLPVQNNVEEANLGSITTELYVETGPISPHSVAMVSRECSPVPGLFEKETVSRATMMRRPRTKESSTSPVMRLPCNAATSTDQVETVGRASSPVHVRGIDEGNMAKPDIQDVSTGTLAISVKSRAIGTKRIKHRNSSTEMPKVHVVEKETCTPFVHQLHKSMATDNIYMADKQTATTVDVTAAYRDLVMPPRPPLINRGTNTYELSPESKQTSPVKFTSFVERAVSPVKIVMVNKAVSVTKGELLEPVDTFQSAGNAGKSAKPIADAPLTRLESIQEDDTESVHEDCDDVSSVTSLSPYPTPGSSPFLSPPRSPKLISPPSPRFRPLGLGKLEDRGGRSSLFTHKEKFTPLFSRSHSSGSSTFACEGKADPSNILWKVEMGTNTPMVDLESRGTSTPTVITHDKAMITEAIPIDHKMADCISKLKTVRQRLEQKQSAAKMVYVQASGSGSMSKAPAAIQTTASLAECSPTAAPLPVRSKSLGDNLNIGGAPSAIPQTTIHKVVSSSTGGHSMSDVSSDDAKSDIVSHVMDPQSKNGHSLARKKRLDISELLRSNSLPESPQPPPSPATKPKIRTVQSQVIPKLSVTGFPRLPKLRSKGKTSHGHKSGSVQSSTSGEEGMSTSGSSMSSSSSSSVVKK